MLPPGTQRLEFHLLVIVIVLLHRRPSERHIAGVAGAKSLLSLLLLPAGAELL